MEDRVQLHPRFLFIGGAPRSGTSMLQKSIGLHSDVYAGPEFENMYDIVHLYRRMMDSQRRQRHDSFSDAETLLAAIVEFSRRVLCSKAYQGQSLFSEKTPKNVLVFKHLAEIFPESRFILVIRDPRAIVASLKQVYSKRSEQEVKSKFGIGLHSDISLVKMYLQSGAEAVERLGDRILTVQYEHLVKDSRRCLNGICEFLQIPFQEEMLHTEKENTSSGILEKGGDIWYSKDQYDRPPDASSMDKWKERLTPYEIDMVSAAFQHLPLMSHYDLRWKPAWKSSLIHRLYLSRGYADRRNG